MDGVVSQSVVESRYLSGLTVVDDDGLRNGVVTAAQKTTETPLRVRVLVLLLSES